MSTKKDDAPKGQELAHIWQAHRLKCLELAIQVGAEPEQATSVAEEFGRYILTKSDIEKAQADSTEEKA